MGNTITEVATSFCRHAVVAFGGHDLFYITAVCWRTCSPEQIFGTCLPGCDIDQLKSKLAFEEVDHFLIIHKFHRPPAEPVAHIGEVTHAAIKAIAQDPPDQIRKAADLFLHCDFPAIPQHHEALL